MTHTIAAARWSGWVRRHASNLWHGPTAPLRSLAAPVGFARTLGGVLVGMPMLVLSLLVWYLAARIATYGLFWGDGNHDNAWGGPTLLGAWIVHGLFALGIGFVAMAMLAPLRRTHDRLCQREHAGFEVS